MTEVNPSLKTKEEVVVAVEDSTNNSSNNFSSNVAAAVVEVVITPSISRFKTNKRFQKSLLGSNKYRSCLAVVHVRAFGLMLQISVL